MQIGKAYGFVEVERIPQEGPACRKPSDLVYVGYFCWKGLRGNAKEVPKTNGASEAAESFFTTQS
jgi:hypothetical protein